MRFGAVLSALVACAAAVFTDEAYVKDWQIVNVGVPVLAHPLKDNDILVFTDRHQLARIAASGDIAWRRGTQVDRFSVSPGKKQAATFGPQLEVWDLASGALQNSLPAADDVLWARDGLFVVIRGQATSLYSTETGFKWTKDFPHPVVGARTESPGSTSVEILFEHETQKFHIESGSSTGSSSQKNPKPAKSIPALDLGPDLRLVIDDQAVVQLMEVKSSSESSIPLWTRHEGLSHVIDAAFLEPAVVNAPVLNATLPLETYKLHEPGARNVWVALGSRVTRDFWRLRDLGVKGLVQSAFGFVTKTPASQILEAPGVLVCLTSRGTVYGLDTSEKGRIAWERPGMGGTTLKVRGEKVEVRDDRGLVAILNAQGEDMAEILAPALPDGFDYVIQGGKVQGTHAVNGIISYTWEFEYSAGPNSNTEVVGIAYRNPKDVTASVGEVDAKGNARYKYLNRNVLAVAVYDAASQHLEVTLLDGVSGRVLHSGQHPDPVVVSPQHPFTMAFGEHWLVYSYYSLDQAHGHKLTLWDLWDTAPPATERIDVLGADVPDPEVVKHTLALGTTVQALDVSRTKFGVVLRNVLVATLDGQIIAVPKAVISGSKAQADLGKSPAVLPIVPGSMVVSHSRTVWGVRGFATVPTALESTYELAAFGALDVFGTLVSPSGEIDRLPATFARRKLAVIVGVLALGTLYLAQWARQRQLRSAWL